MTDSKIKRVLVQLIISPDEESEKFVYEIIARNPDREVRILAYKTLIRNTEESIQRAERIQADAAPAAISRLMKESLTLSGY